MQSGERQEALSSRGTRGGSVSLGEVCQLKGRSAGLEHGLASSRNRASAEGSVVSVFPEVAPLN